MNLTGLLDNTVSRWPHRAALVEGHEVVTYAGLAERVATFAGQLRGLNLPAGCRVGLSFPNSINYVALTFALWRVNAVIVPLPTECPEEELHEIAEVMQLEAVLCSKASANSTSLAPDCHVTRLSPAVAADNHGLNLAFIRFTSGTTSARKGVALCHETVRDRVMTANKAFKIGPDDIVMWCLPMAHHFLITIVLYLSHGATVVLASVFPARPFLEAIQQHRASVLYAAPFHYSLLAQDKSGLQLDSVRLAVSTTCGLPPEVAAEFQKRFGRPLVQALGIIEMGLVALNTDDPTGRPNSVGRPLPDFQVQIDSPDAEGCGDVVIRGPGLFDAYAAPWVARDAALRDGWFCTGDIGRIDADGFLFLLSRKHAVINLAGRKVFPEEVESVLNRHPDVRESRAFGRVHPHLGEVVEAELVLEKPGTDLHSLREFCRSHLASYKIPSRFHVVNALPRTATTGKIIRTVAVA